MELEARCCTLCGPSAPKRIKYRERLGTAQLTRGPVRDTDRRHCRMVTCGGCGLVFADPAPAPGQLFGLKTCRGWHDEPPEEDKYASYAPILDRALALAPSRRCFLEVGGQSGYMLRYGVENGFDTQIEVEPASDAAERFVACGPKARFLSKAFEPGLLKANSVSLACSFQVLGHTDDPLAMVRGMLQVLEPGGVVLAVVHNSRAMPARVLGERSPIFGITNTHLFNGNNAYQLFKRAGFAHIEVHTLSNRYSARHWLALLPTPHGLKQRAESYLRQSPLGHMKISLHAGNIAIIGRKPLGDA